MLVGHSSGNVRQIGNLLGRRDERRVAALLGAADPKVSLLFKMHQGVASSRRTLRLVLELATVASAATPALSNKLDRRCLFSDLDSPPFLCLFLHPYLHDKIASMVVEIDHNINIDHKTCSKCQVVRVSGSQISH